MVDVRVQLHRSHPPRLPKAVSAAAISTETLQRNQRVAVSLQTEPLIPLCVRVMCVCVCIAVRVMGVCVCVCLHRCACDGCVRVRVCASLWVCPFEMKWCEDEISE